jgi:hypothetical protein
VIYPDFIQTFEVLMKILFSMLIILTCLVSSKSFAQSENTKIREVNDWQRSLTPAESCVDEYFKRRRNLIIKMSASPVLMAGAMAGGAFVGGAGGGAAFALGLIQQNGVFAELAAIVGGAFVGIFTGTVGEGLDSTFTVINFFRNQNLLRLIYEVHHDGGVAVNGFYQEFKELYPDSQLGVEEFSTFIRSNDETGKLCDGSLASPRRLRTGNKLKHRLATRKDIYRAAAEI